jgi:hypothetical protein
VDLSSCWKLIDAGVAAALQDKPLLNTVEIRGCSHISAALRDELRNRGIRVIDQL